jgi:hypothetical protein
MEMEPKAAQMENMELLKAMEEMVAAHLKEIREEMRADHEEMRVIRSRSRKDEGLSRKVLSLTERQATK